MNELVNESINEKNTKGECMGENDEWMSEWKIESVNFALLSFTMTEVLNDKNNNPRLWNRTTVFTTAKNFKELL